MENTIIAILAGGILGGLIWAKGRGVIADQLSKLAEKEVKKIEKEVKKEEAKIEQKEAEIKEIEANVEKEKNAPQTTNSLIDFFTNRYRK